jgi:hypothetical protein
MNMKNKLKTILLALTLLTSFEIKAQNETRFWYFGTNAGLDFSTVPPTALTNGSVNTGEGCASMSDAAGNLLFYTDGVTVYNKNHAVMANGTGLAGSFSSTQSALIVQWPSSPDLYYIFTTDASGSGGTNGLKYSIVNMSLAAGIGSVTVKNLGLYVSSTEKLAAVKHCNNTDTWIISHDLNTNVFRSVLLSPAGISLMPVLSPVGSNIETIGQMKLSPNGRKLAIAGFGPSGGFTVFDFDPATGTVFNPLPLFSSYYAYGCEFSPDGTKLYGSDHVSNEIYQWDLCAGSNAAIVASQYTITAPAGNPYLSGMQLGPDKKIYIALKYLQSLSVIANPNAAGAACNYQHMTQSIAPKTNGMGLPTFMSTRAPSPAFTYTSACQSASFTAGSVPNNACNAANYTLTGTQWLFGDPASGNNNSASGTSAVHSFPGPGTYSVKCLYVYQCSSDTVLIPVTINNGAPSMSVAGTFTICKGDARTYTVSGASTYSWSNAINTSTIALNPTVTTVYTVTGTNVSNGCQASRSMTVTVNNCTDIEEQQNGTGSLQVYPNPFEESLQVRSPKAVALTIFNHLGSVVLEQVLLPGDHSLDTSLLPTGFYFVTILAEGTKTNLRLVKTGR